MDLGRLTSKTVFEGNKLVYLRSIYTKISIVFMLIKGAYNRNKI